MESGWLLPGGSSDARPVDPFGFSWPVEVSLRKPDFRALYFLGFPWILSDSLVRIETYQWVIRHKPKNKFLRVSASWRPSKRPERAPVVKVRRKGQNSPCAKPNTVSEFLEEIPVQAVRPRSPRPMQLAPLDGPPRASTGGRRTAAPRTVAGMPVTGKRWRKSRSARRPRRSKDWCRARGVSLR
jgi:hypothetical protein